jgi:hypothetical protein
MSDSKSKKLEALLEEETLVQEEYEAILKKYRLRDFFDFICDEIDRNILTIAEFEKVQKDYPCSRLVDYRIRKAKLDIVTLTNELEKIKEELDND